MDIPEIIRAVHEAGVTGWKAVASICFIMFCWAALQGYKAHVANKPWPEGRIPRRDQT